MGLIARAIETAGIPTTSLTSAWSITAAAHPPRAVYTDFPLGHTAGPPGDAATQLAIARQAFDSFEAITESGTIMPTAHQWPEPWREQARELADHRSERFATPQYQNDADRAAAVESYGEDAACGACVS